MSEKIPPPASCDLTLPCRRIAEIAGVSPATAYRWKKAAGIEMRRGGRGVQNRSVKLWGLLSAGDWEKGYEHIGRAMGVSRQAVCQIRKRLIRDGHLSGKRTVLEGP